MGILERHDKGAVAHLRLNAPERLNPLSDAMLAALQEQIEALREDRKIRAVVLSGAGKVFCAGHDLKEMQAKAAESDPSTLRRGTRDANLKIEKEAQRALWEGSYKQCTTCSMPIFNPDDPEYPEKMKCIERMWEAPLPKCKCGA